MSGGSADNPNAYRDEVIQARVERKLRDLEFARETRSTHLDLAAIDEVFFDVWEILCQSCDFPSKEESNRGRQVAAYRDFLAGYDFDEFPDNPTDMFLLEWNTHRGEPLRCTAAYDCDEHFHAIRTHYGWGEHVDSVQADSHVPFRDLFGPLLRRGD